MFTMFVVYEDDSWDEMDFAASEVVKSNIKLAKKQKAAYIQVTRKGKLVYSWGDESLAF